MALSVAITSIRLLFWPQSLMNVAMGILCCLFRKDGPIRNKENVYSVPLLSNNVYWNLSWQVLRNFCPHLLRYTPDRRRKTKIIDVSHCQLLQHSGLKANDICLIHASSPVKELWNIGVINVWAARRLPSIAFPCACKVLCVSHV